MAEQGCEIGVAAEPYQIPQNHALWAGSRCGLVAVTWRRNREPVLFSKFGKGDGFVVVKWSRVYVAGVYISPNVDTASYERLLADLRDCVLRIPPARREILVAGDFNAKSALWGSPATDRRGRILEAWTAGLGLVVLNTGTAQTCVRRQGGP
ncbi:uncharacterized protein [Temnothorax longispinosus]|uniref:uncharacterized protein n=1 Tax=Temnothorax longispinosus TaxID=300112 RepID=UPI003A9A4C00